MDDRGNQAEQSLTRGTVRRLRYRPSRHRLQQRGVPGDAQKWPQTRHGGVHHQPEDNALYTRSARRGGILPDHAQHVKKRTEVNTWVSTCKPLTNQGTTLRRRCVYGARGARLTHSQTATPENQYSSTAQDSRLGKHEQMDDPDEKKPKERTHSG